MISRSWLTASSSYLTNGGESSPLFFRKTNPTSPLESVKRCQNEPKRTQLWRPWSLENSDRVGVRSLATRRLPLHAHPPFLSEKRTQLLL